MLGPLLLLVWHIYNSEAVYGVLGNNAKLTCPFPPGAWSKYTPSAWIQLTNGDKYDYVNSSEITVRNIEITDSGEYLCNGPSEYSIIFLYVIVYAEEGSTVVWTCPFSGNNYNWQKYTGDNWDELRSNGTYSNVSVSQITIHNVDITDSGQYRCNVNGRPSNQIVLNVATIPAVYITNQTYLAIIGGNITLDCTVTAHPAASDIWWEDGQGTSLKESRYTGGNLSNPSLTINNVIESDSGLYTCHAANRVGTNSQTTQLKAGYIPSAEIERDYYVLTIGKNATIVCNVTNADAIHWYRNGTVLNEDKKYDFGFISDPYLVIYDIRLIDSGEYTCEVTNKFGYNRDGTFLKIVHSVISTSNYEKTVNESVTLQCLIYDATDVKWLHTEVYVTTASIRYSGGNITVPSLTITQLSKDDAGMYQCESLFESVSSVSSAVELKIREDTKYNGSTAEIPSLTIYNIENIDLGIYVCYVKNSIGSSSGSSIKLAIQEPSQSVNIGGPVAGGVSGGIAVFSFVAVVLFIYTKRNWTNSTQNHDYETRENPKAENHLYEETQRPNSNDRKSPVYINTSEGPISSQNDIGTTLRMYDVRDFMRVLRDKSSLSRHISKEFETLNSMPILSNASDYEIIDIKSKVTTTLDTFAMKPSANTVEKYTQSALIKKHDDRTGYIITTVPDQSDSDNFWTMITNYHVGYIALLVQEMEKISEFFPNTTEPINTQRFKVEICSFDKLKNNLFKFVLDISNKEKKTVVQVKLYKTTNWKVGEIHPPIDTMCKLLDAIRSKESGMVALLGNNGIGFPVCANLGACQEVFHAINTESVFNILQIVVGLKNIRPDLFQSCEEYNLCYEVISYFLQNEHAYAEISEHI